MTMVVSRKRAKKISRRSTSAGPADRKEIAISRMPIRVQLASQQRNLHCTYKLLSRLVACAWVLAQLRNHLRKPVRQAAVRCTFQTHLARFSCRALKVREAKNECGTPRGATS